MSWDDVRPNLVWRFKTWRRNQRWNAYWDWGLRDALSHVADITSYWAVFTDDDDAFLELVPKDQKTCKFCGRVGVRSFTKAGQDTWRCSAIKACVARTKVSA